MWWGSTGEDRGEVLEGVSKLAARVCCYRGQRHFPPCGVLDRTVPPQPGHQDRLSRPRVEGWACDRPGWANHAVLQVREEPIRCKQSCF